ncbi:MAG: FkbM family methyltransferase [Ruminococcus flavefaciens]|nr:FkbM family methyltransferase [Ruminococcus flavefaciens]
MGFSEIRTDYQKGITDKKAFCKLMFEEYKKLFQFRDLLQESNAIEEIRINSREVIASIRCADSTGKEYLIDMGIDSKDVSAISVQILSTGQYEQEELEMVMRIVRYLSDKNGEGIVWDIGANLGWYTLNVCKQYGNFECYAFEPVKETYLQLMRNVEINKLRNCKLYNIGFSDKNVREQFYYNTAASGASSLVNLLEDESTKIIQCNFERLDDFAARNNVPGMDFVKCDVEGAELLVYQGGLETIKKYKPIVFSEMLRKWSAKFNYHPNHIIELFESLGYQCYVIQNKKLKEFGRVDEDTLETNYFFLHKEKHRELIKLLE